MFAIPFFYLIGNHLSGIPLDAKTVRAFHLEGKAQGTTYSVTYFAKDSLIRKSSVDSIALVIDKSMSLYRPGSTINRFNASKAGLAVDDHFAKVVEKAVEIYKSSGGVFDITVRPLVEAWGFGVIKPKSPPIQADLDRMLSYVGTNKIKLTGHYLFKSDPRIKIDLNGIAQGYTVDVISDFIRKKGISSFIVELGGELRVLGRRPDTKKKFTVGIEKPNADSLVITGYQDVLALDHGGVTTSGNYRNYYVSKGKKIAHLIDPKTGFPLQNEMISATVYAKDALTADGYDNVFMGLGVKQSFAFLKQHPELDIYLIYKKPNGTVGDTASVGFKKLLEHE